MREKRNLILGSPDNEAIFFRHSHKMECVRIKDIAFIKSDKVYSIIHKINGEHIEKKIICYSLKSMENSLKNYGFIRCHKYFLINCMKIDSFNSNTKTVILNGLTLPVSRRKSVKVFTYLLQIGIKDRIEETVINRWENLITVKKT
jgi:DNA-binding LytR/AlgR family response regulator